MFDIEREKGYEVEVVERWRRLGGVGGGGNMKYI